MTEQKKLEMVRQIFSHNDLSAGSDLLQPIVAVLSEFNILDFTFTTNLVFEAKGTHIHVFWSQRYPTYLCFYAPDIIETIYTSEFTIVSIANNFDEFRSFIKEYLFNIETLDIKKL